MNPVARTGGDEFVPMLTESSPNGLRCSTFSWPRGPHREGASWSPAPANI